ncbi:MAG: hypothetical protein PGN13_13255 [Patulibacter minatonensis]
MVLLPRREHGLTAGVVQGEVDEAVRVVLEHDGVPDQSGEIGEHAARALAGEDDLDESVLELVGPAQQRELAVEQHAVDRLRHLDEAQLAVQRDDGQLHGVRGVDQRLRDRTVERPPELDHQTAGALRRERVDETLLALRLLARAETGREDQLSAAQEVRRILHVEDVHPPHVAAQRLGSGHHLGQSAAERRQFEHLGDRHPARMIRRAELAHGGGLGCRHTGQSVMCRVSPRPATCRHLVIRPASTYGASCGRRCTRPSTASI